jgi:ribosomal protein S3
MKFLEKEEKILNAIGYFYLEENEYDYKETSKNLKELSIHNITYENSRVNIYLERPGLMIGKKGENLEKLTGYISNYIKEKISITVMEMNINDHLIPFNYSLEELI